MNGVSLVKVDSFKDWLQATGHYDIQNDMKNPQFQFEYQQYVQDQRTVNQMVMLQWQMAIEQTKDILDMAKRL